MGVCQCGDKLFSAGVGDEGVLGGALGEDEGERERKCILRLVGWVVVVVFIGGVQEGSTEEFVYSEQSFSRSIDSCIGYN